jgi:Pyridine nucleotide-disulphide oxidoreductase
MRPPVQPPRAPAQRQSVAAVGGGFAGLNLIQHLRDAPVNIVLVDRCNHHLFQPLLYQVATPPKSRSRRARWPACRGPSARRASHSHCTHRASGAEEQWLRIRRQAHANSGIPQSFKFPIVRANVSRWKRA